MKYAVDNTPVLISEDVDAENGEEYESTVASPTVNLNIASALANAGDVHDEQSSHAAPTTLPATPTSKYNKILLRKPQLLPRKRIRGNNTSRRVSEKSMLCTRSARRSDLQNREDNEDDERSSEARAKINAKRYDAYLVALT